MSNENSNFKNILDSLTAAQLVIEDSEFLSVETACGVLQDLNNARLKIVAEKRKQSVSKDKKYS